MSPLALPSFLPFDHFTTAPPDMKGDDEGMLSDISDDDDIFNDQLAKAPTPIPTKDKASTISLSIFNFSKGDKHQHLQETYFFIHELISYKDDSPSFFTPRHSGSVDNIIIKYLQLLLRPSTPTKDLLEGAALLMRIKKETRFSFSPKEVTSFFGKAHDTLTANKEEIEALPNNAALLSSLANTCACFSYKNEPLFRLLAKYFSSELVKRNTTDEIRCSILKALFLSGYTSMLNDFFPTEFTDNNIAEIIATYFFLYFDDSEAIPLEGTYHFVKLLSAF
jgi:hypothetical protein